MRGIVRQQRIEALHDAAVERLQRLSGHGGLRLLRQGVMAQLVIQQQAGQRIALRIERQACFHLGRAQRRLQLDGGLAQLVLLLQQLLHQLRIALALAPGQAVEFSEQPLHDPQRLHQLGRLA
ncbi:hypothetical protein D3C81_1411520 [compost metagenome]